MTITGGTALPKDEMEKMIREAEQFAAEDHRRRELAEARNMADNLAYQTEKTLKEHGDKLSEPDRKAVETALADVKEALKTDDAARIKSASDVLVTASHKLAEQIYQTSQAGSSGGGSPAGGTGGHTSNDDDVVDAEIVDEGGQAAS